MEFSKKNLLSLINENINEMAMDFDSPERPNQDLQNKLAQGDTPLKKVPLPKTGQEPNMNFQELLASERYKQVVANVRQYTNYQGTINGTNGMMNLLPMMYDAHNKIIQIESNHREALETLAVQLVMEEMGIQEGQLNFDAKIVGMGEINTEDFNREQGQQPNPDEVNVDDENPEQPQENAYQEVEEELFLDLQQLDLERAKRRLINSIIQGASKRGHYMYHFVADKISEITGSDELFNLYGIMMSVNDANYWQFEDAQIAAAGDSVAGKAQVNVDGGEDEEGEEGEQTPTVIARGINFPVLVHELIKGTLEVIGSHGQPGEHDNPQDRAMFQKVMELEDTLEKEMWDLRLGPAIWDRVRSQFPDEVILENGKMLQNYMLMQIFQLPAKQFLVLMKEVISNSDNGKRLMADMMKGIQEMFNQQDYEETMNQFHSDLETMSEETDEDDLKNMLNDMGINLSNDNDDEDDEDDLYKQLGIDRPKQ